MNPRNNSRFYKKRKPSQKNEEEFLNIPKKPPERFQKTSELMTQKNLSPELIQLQILQEKGHQKIQEARYRLVFSCSEPLLHVYLDMLRKNIALQCQVMDLLIQSY